MNKETLYRFFEGSATFDEEKQIREWMEHSEANSRFFMKSRKEYDALILTGSGSYLGRKRSVLPFFHWVAGISAAVAVVLIIGGLYLFTGKSQPEQYNTVIVPPGQRINLILSDNTNLWLNANTSFRYPTEFAKDNRTVFLDGEAYFEVSENVKKPFIVKTQEGEVHVTGTTFNVEAYSQYNSFNTSLFEGGVNIYKNEKKLMSLHPNEKSTFENNQWVVSEITDSDAYLWREGLIAFKSKGLEEILLTLEKYFDVEIQVEMDNLPQRTYTGKFRQSDGVDYALRVLQKSIHFSYQRDETTGIVYIK